MTKVGADELEGDVNAYWLAELWTLMSRNGVPAMMDVFKVRDKMFVLQLVPPRSPERAEY